MTSVLFNIAGFAARIAPPDLPGLEKYTESFGRYPGGNISYLYALDTLDLVIITAYFAILFFLAIYGAYRLRIVYQFWRYARKQPSPAGHFDESDLPAITVQLPLFNEMYVAERIIDACAALDYPADLLEIQVLDDSTDETTEVVAARVAYHRERGVNVTHIHRTDRTGYKAGALENGLKVAQGTLVAVFDADFVPRPDCLRRMVDYFTNPGIGMVQMRWSHINRDYSLLTKVQALMLDGHFVVEQAARNRSGAFFNFNGTAGMWRRDAIDWSGGWQHDTLTEDTDLSFRAQLCGWQFVYLLDDDVPSELPVDMNAFKAQQRRWAKGLSEVAIKLMPSVARQAPGARAAARAVLPSHRQHRRAARHCAGRAEPSGADRSLQPGPLPPARARCADPAVLDRIGRRVLCRRSDLPVPERLETEAALPAVVDGARNRAQLLELQGGA